MQIIVSAALFCCSMLVASALPLATTPPPALRCSQVLSPQTMLDQCASFSPSRSQIRTLLNRIKTFAEFIVNNASCHPIYSALQPSEVNMTIGINPSAKNSYALGYAVKTMQECFYPAIRNLTHSESLFQMDNQLFNFATEFRAIEGDITALVPLLHQLARSNVNLSQGTTCTVPSVTCISPQYPSTRVNGAQFTPGQVRLMKLINIADSTRNYARDLAGLDFLASET